MASSELHTGVSFAKVVQSGSLEGAVVKSDAGKGLIEVAGKETQTSVDILTVTHAKLEANKVACSVFSQNNLIGTPPLLNVMADSV